MKKAGCVRNSLHTEEDQVADTDKETSDLDSHHSQLFINNFHSNTYLNKDHIEDIFWT